MIAPIPETNSTITPVVPHGEVTLAYNKTESKMELNPQVMKKVVRIPLCLPNAYSLIILQLGLNSGLTKCKINKQSNDKEAKAMVRIDR
jgi:hypothetical protein